MKIGAQDHFHVSPQLQRKPQLVTISGAKGSVTSDLNMYYVIVIVKNYAKRDFDIEYTKDGQVCCDAFVLSFPFFFHVYPFVCVNVNYFVCLISRFNLNLDIVKV